MTMSPGPTYQIGIFFLVKIYTALRLKYGIAYSREIHPRKSGEIHWKEENFGEMNR
jgi:hypothetical protein